MMRLLTAILILISAMLSQTAIGQVLPSTPGGITNPVTQFRAERFGYQFDQNLNDTMLYDGGSGMTGYITRNREGRVISQGTVYDSIRNIPLEAPPYNPPPRSGPPYGSSNFQSIADGPLFSR